MNGTVNAYSKEEQHYSLAQHAQMQTIFLSFFPQALVTTFVT